MSHCTINIFSPDYLQRACSEYNLIHQDHVTLADMNTFLLTAIIGVLSEEDKKKYYAILDSSRKTQEEESKNSIRLC
jgi:hypothetical protein